MAGTSRFCLCMDLCLATDDPFFSLGTSVVQDVSDDALAVAAGGALGGPNATLVWTKC